jgi:hypothetical protein
MEFEGTWEYAKQTNARATRKITMDKDRFISGELWTSYRKLLAVPNSLK